MILAFRIALLLHSTWTSHATCHNEEAAAPACTSHVRHLLSKLTAHCCQLRPLLTLCPPIAQSCWMAFWSSCFHWYANTQALMNTSRQQILNIQLTLTLHFMGFNSLICKSYSSMNLTTIFNKTEKAISSVMKNEHHVFLLLWQHSFFIFHLSSVLGLNKSVAEFCHGHQLFLSACCYWKWWHLDSRALS